MSHAAAAEPYFSLGNLQQRGAFSLDQNCELFI